MALHYLPSKFTNQQDKVVNKAVFFDRDGVLNHLVERANGEFTAPWDVSEFDLIPGAKMAVDLVKSKGFKASLDIVQNWSSVTGPEGINQLVIIANQQI